MRTYLNGVADGTATAQTGSLDAQGTTPYQVGFLKSPFADNSGAKLPTTTGQSTFDGSSSTWANPGNIVSDNSVFATTSPPSGGNISAGGTNYLYAGGFGFTIPTGAVISGYMPAFQGYAGLTHTIAAAWYFRPLYSSATGQGYFETGNFIINASPTENLFQSTASTLTGASFTAAQINDSNFGVALRLYNSAASFDPVSVDYIQLTIFYYTILTLDEIAIYNAALTAGVAADHYQTGVTGISSTTASVNKQVIGADGTSDFAFGGAVVTSLPGSPADGQEIYYLADSTNGIVWHLKYRAASGSAYKWEYVGGPPLYSRVDTSQTSITNTTYVAPTSPCSLTVPLAGDYDLSIESSIWNATAGFINAFASYTVGATAASDNWAASAGIAGVSAAVVKTTRHTGIAASAVIAERVRVDAGGTLNIAGRRLRAVPVRVG